jgi:broad specificity phosphatase PhoE
MRCVREGAGENFYYYQGCLLPSPPPMNTKLVYLVRHAESAENALMQGVSRGVGALFKMSLPSLDDVKLSVALASTYLAPSSGDCQLSDNGKAQIDEVKQMLLASRAEETREMQVVVHSPLLRAKHTCQGLFKPGELLSGNVQVMELESLREISTIDYAPIRYSRALQRIQEFESWVSQRPEDKIIVVGHSHYFRAMLGVDFKFSNCEVWKATFDPQATDPTRRWTNLERLCGSSTAKPTFGAEGPDAWDRALPPARRAGASNGGDHEGGDGVVGEMMSNPVQ